MSRINTNVQSLIARRALNMNNAALTQALQRLSTGLRINTGKDDPAGLIASETLRSSMRATEQAIANAVRADTIIAVAEGALQEVGALLLELEALVDQSANVAGLTAQEVSANQMQIDSILQSINRIADSAAFGDAKLLNGNYDFTTSGVNINEPTGATLDHLDRVLINAAKVPNGSFRAVSIEVLSGSTYAMLSGRGAGGLGGATGSSISDSTTIQIRGNYGSERLSFASGTQATAIVTAINSSSQLTGVSAVISGAGTVASPLGIVFTSTDYGSNAFVSVSILENLSALSLPGGATNQDYGTDGNITVNGTTGIVSGLDLSIRSGSLSADMTLSAAFGSTDGGNTSFEITGGGAQFSISPTVGLAGMEAIGISEVSTGKLGNNGLGFLATLGSGLTNDLASKNFTEAQRIVREAVNQVASLRGRLGGFQKNTLQSTINSLGVAYENVTAAESAIRDADFAVETSALTRAQILVNSSTAILQIANAQPQNALALLG